MYFFSSWELQSGAGPEYHNKRKTHRKTHGKFICPPSQDPTMATILNRTCWHIPTPHTISSQIIDILTVTGELSQQMQNAQKEAGWGGGGG